MQIYGQGCSRDVEPDQEILLIRINFPLKDF